MCLISPVIEFQTEGAAWKNKLCPNVSNVFLQNVVLKICKETAYKPNFINDWK